MGLFTCLIKNLNVAGVIAKKAHEEYMKFKMHDTDITEAEIAQVIFMLRGSSQNYGRYERLRFNSYLEKNIDIDSLYKLCLAIVYIELNISPSDGKAFFMATEAIQNELFKYGYKCKFPESNFW